MLYCEINVLFNFGHKSNSAERQIQIDINRNASKTTVKPNGCHNRTNCRESIGYRPRGVTRIILGHFSRLLPGVNLAFPGSNFHFGKPKKNSVVLKVTKNKKFSWFFITIFSSFSTLHFHFPLSILHCLASVSLFPKQLAKFSQWKVSASHPLPLKPLCGLFLLFSRLTIIRCTTSD